MKKRERERERLREKNEIIGHFMSIFNHSSIGHDYYETLDNCRESERVREHDNVF